MYMHDLWLKWKLYYDAPLACKQHLCKCWWKSIKHVTSEHSWLDYAPSLISELEIDVWSLLKVTTHFLVIRIFLQSLIKICQELFQELKGKTDSRWTDLSREKKLLVLGTCKLRNGKKRKETKRNGKKKKTKRKQGEK